MKFLLRIGFVAGLAALPAMPVSADENPGAYLAGRTAFANNDFVESARYFARAMSRDPQNLELVESTALSYLAQGSFDSAVSVARRLLAIDENNQLGRLLFMSKAAIEGDFESAAEYLDGDAINPLIGDLARAWVAAGSGNMADALDQFDAVAGTSGLRNLGLIHKGFALVTVGDLEGAAEVFAGDEANGPVAATKRMTQARAEVLSNIERRDEALEVLDQYLANSPDPAIMDLRDRLQAEEIPGLTVVTTPLEGLSEVFYSVGSVLIGETDDVFALAYIRLAEFIRPTHVDATLLAAGLLEDMGQYDLANLSYDRIEPDDPAHFSAELGRANVLWMAEKQDDAIEVLRQLAQDYPQIARVHAALGDLLRRQQKYDEASRSYDVAIDLIAGTEAEDWFLYYTRGITHEREDRWTLAEADFRRALELSPDQPQVLNYIGYSFVEMQTNLDEALEMIERAVELRPRDGYITDSLGWVYYRLGRYDEAAEVMERAAQLMPIDPIVNDHLGDTLWAVGRKLEARFQWQRALSFEPEEEDAIRIRRKLEVGLDQVLAEEGAEPLAVGNDG